MHPTETFECECCNDWDLLSMELYFIGAMRKSPVCLPVIFELPCVFSSKIIVAIISYKYLFRMLVIGVIDVGVLKARISVAL
jgi:hypothetical protein